jgi:hypothetical protein
VSWNAVAPEDPLKVPKYIEILRWTAAAVLGQETASNAAGLLKAPYFVQWAIESNNGGGYESKKKFGRATYELVAGPDGLTSRCPPTETAHVEHVWTIEKTKLLLVDAYTLAQQALAACRLTRAQCIEALMTIIEVRRHTVLMPASLMHHEQFRHNTAFDGFTARYGTCMVIRRGGVKIDFETEDKEMQATVDDAFEYLRVGSGNRSWPWQRSSVAALSKPMVTITQPETINAATTLQRVTWADFEIALISLGWSIDRPTSSNKRDSGWHGVFKSVPHKAALPRGDFVTQGKEFLLAQMDRADFERAVNTLVQQRMKVVY